MTIDQKAINALKILAVDAVEQAKSGHPGMPLGMAELAACLWMKHLNFNPKNPPWQNRDRFVLSNGHGSMLLYALLHLSGYDLDMAEIRNFRQLGSKTPGHPEYGLTPGVETTTGPLGQGLANGVGMALSEKLLAAEFNRPGHELIDHHTYVFLGDGCMMEGISHEVCSLAGVWGLNKLIAIYDSNNISIDGEIEDWHNEDSRKRFESYGWNVIGPINGHIVTEIDDAIALAKKSSNKPSLIIAKTIIGHGSPNKQGKESSHGSPLGAEEIAALRKKLNWELPPFEIPADIYKMWQDIPRIKAAYKEWQERDASYQKAFPLEHKELNRRLNGELPADWKRIAANICEQANNDKTEVASRKSSLNILNNLAPHLPELFGGSADLTSSNLTKWTGAKAFTVPKFIGNYASFGVREFGMFAILNGMSLHAGLKVFAGTFLTFSDYCRNAIRMAALMKINVVFVFSHDSIGLGEDGPTHQAVEHAASLRLIPGLDVWRPADTAETAVAWCNSLEAKKPSAILLSRQNLPQLDKDDASQIHKGGYILQSNPAAKAQIIATGSEVGLAVTTAKLLEAKGIAVEVVSMPCTTIFDMQPASYRTQVIKAGLPKLVLEAGVTDLWHKYINKDDIIIGVDTFGESAPADDLFKHFGLTAENASAKLSALVLKN